MSLQEVALRRHDLRDAVHRVDVLGHDCCHCSVEQRHYREGCRHEKQGPENTRRMLNERQSAAATLIEIPPSAAPLDPVSATTPSVTDRHDVFHDELASRRLGDAIDFGHRRPALGTSWLFHTAATSTSPAHVGRGKGWLDEGDTPACPCDLRGAPRRCRAAWVPRRGHARQLQARLPDRRAASCRAQSRAAGFCVFNDCGVAAEYLRANYGCNASPTSTSMRIMATACSTASRTIPDLIFADIHEDGRYLYPGTGRRERNRHGPGARHQAQHPDGAGRRTTMTFARAWARVEVYRCRRRPSSSCSSAVPTASRATRSHTFVIPNRHMPTPLRRCAGWRTKHCATAASSARAAAATTAATSRARGRGWSVVSLEAG